MSDYMFKLESHLSTDQFCVVGQMQAVAAAAGVNLFLTGGAMRDMLGGFPVRDLDFTVEGSALKLAKILTQKYEATIVSTDELRKSVEMRFPGSVRVELAMARTEKFAKSGARPQVTPATIHEDLRMPGFHGQCDRALAEQGVAWACRSILPTASATSSARNCGRSTTIPSTTIRCA